MKKLAALTLACAAFVGTATPAWCSDWFVDTKITIIEPDYAPGVIAFQISSPGGTCAVGSWINYLAQGTTAEDKRANVAAVLRALLTAQARSATVRIYGTNSGCTVQNIWIMATS